MSAISSEEWQRNAEQRGRMAKLYALTAGIGTPVAVAAWTVTEQWPFLMLAALASLYLLPAWFYFSAHRICLTARDNARRHEEQADLRPARARVRLQAFVRDCVIQGDMTPAAERMLTRILEDEK